MTAPPGGVSAHIRSLLPSLLPTERAVAAVFLDQPDAVVEMSSQQVAEAAGASRATVVRTCQSLGYSGYQQLRVLLARDAGPRRGPAAPAPHGPGPIVASTFQQVADSVPGMLALLDHADVARAVEALATARRVLVIGNGLSAPLAADTAGRFGGIGRPAEAPPDAIAQQIAARQLGAEDVALVIGSGANEASLRVAAAASRGGAKVITLTSFASSALTEIATLSLVIAPSGVSFRDELAHTSRVAYLLFAEVFAAAVAAERGADAVRARAHALEVVSDNLGESESE